MYQNARSCIYLSSEEMDGTLILLHRKDATVIHLLMEKQIKLGGK